MANDQQQNYDDQVLDVNETVRLIMESDGYALDKHGTFDHLKTLGMSTPLELIEIAKGLSVTPVTYGGSGTDITMPLD